MKMLKFEVFQQKHPITKDGESFANLVPVGFVNANDFTEAIEKARTLTRWPVVEQS